MKWIRRILHRKRKGIEIGLELYGLLIGEELLVKYMEAMANESKDVPFKAEEG